MSALVGTLLRKADSVGYPDSMLLIDSANEIERLQARVAELEEAVAIEREACAQICDSVNNHDNPMTASDCADAIRARGEKP